MNEIEPRKRAKKDLAARHVPQLVVPVPFDEVRDFVRRAVKGTSLVDPLAQVFGGYAFFEPHLRYSAVDEEHTLIELDVVGRVPGAQTLLFTRRVGEIDRFFVAVQDELERRERRRSEPPRESGGQPGLERE